MQSWGAYSRVTTTVFGNGRVMGSIEKMANHRNLGLNFTTRYAFPRARLEPPRRELLRGLESRAVPAEVDLSVTINRS